MEEDEQIEEETEEEVVADETESAEDQVLNLEPIVGEAAPIEMSSFDRISMVCILTECLNQLYILRNINTQDSSNFVNKPIEYTSIGHRYMGAENHADFRINSSINNYDKLATDIHWIIQILKECQDEISFKGQFSSLIHAVDVTRRMREDEIKLKEETIKNDKYIEDLRKQYEDEYLNNIRTIEETNSKIQKLRFEVEDLQVYTKYELNYYENWQNTRIELNNMSCEQKEKYYQDIINDTKIKIDTENKGHLELESYIEESKNDYIDEIQYWMKHYDEEIEKRETEMLNLKTLMEKQSEDHQLLQQKYDARKAEIEDWLNYKRIKKEKEDLEALQIWATTKIQAWWRGVMYRKKLGPYRKQKGKGKGKDAKNKKGKKK